MKVTIEDADPERLAAEWATLAGRAINPATFRSAAWMAVWLPMAAKRCRLRVVRGRVGADTVALGVFGLHGTGLLTGLLTGKAARLAETGTSALDDIYVEYNDALLTDRAPQDARRALLSAVLKSTAAQSIVLRNAVPAMRQAALAVGRDAAWVVRVVSENPCYGIALGAPAPYSRNTRQQIGRARRLYEGKGRITVRVADNPETRAAALPRLIDLHEATWRARGQGGAFTPGVRAFHEAFLSRPDAPAEILTIASGERTIGMLYNLIGEGTVHNYQSGFEAEADNRLKPGLVAHDAAMDHYRARGFRDYDLMAGDSRYKRSLGSAHKRLSTIEMEKPSLRQRFRGVARNVRR